MSLVTYPPYQFIIKILDFCLDNWATIVVWGFTYSGISSDRAAAIAFRWALPMGDNMDHDRKNNWIMYIIIGALLIAIIGANMLYYVNKTETGKIVNVTKIGNGCSKWKMRKIWRSFETRTAMSRQHVYSWVCCHGCGLHGRDGFKYKVGTPANI